MTYPNAIGILAWYLAPGGGGAYNIAGSGAYGWPTGSGIPTGRPLPPPPPGVAWRGAAIPVRWGKSRGLAAVLLPGEAPPPPAIRSIAPPNASTGGGTPITIDGSGFLTASSVTIGGVPVPFVVVDDNTITAIVPPLAAAPQNVVVTGPGGPSAPGTVTTWTPQIVSVTPNTGPVEGGTPVTVAGFYFTGATSAAIDGVPLTAFVVVDDNTITGTTAILPLGLLGARVDNVTDFGTAIDVYTATEAPPTIGSIVPPYGATAGGETVAIFGARLLYTTGVTFGGVPAPTFSVVGENEITVETPPHAPAVVDVQVTTLGGTDTALAAFTFTDVPAPLSVLPNAFISGLTPLLTVTGSGFTGATQVAIGGIPCTGLAVATDTSLTCHPSAATPPSPPGFPYPLTVTGPLGIGTLPAAVTVLPP